MPVSVTSYHSESSSRVGSSYSPSYYRTSLPSTFRSTSSYTQSYRSTSGLDDGYSSSRNKSDTSDSLYSSSRLVLMVAMIGGRISHTRQLSSSEQHWLDDYYWKSHHFCDN
ncbi:hypothetical protein J6590_022947 [Homalodisca vitripennis]|nr:hypothetical protein J6590_022947 [Homalodisca vitripennis]